MKLYIRAIIFVVLLLFPLLGCSEEAEPANDDPFDLVLERDIVGNWSPIDSDTGQIWQFLEDGTFIDTENVSYGYEIRNINGINYLAFDRKGLNIDLDEGLERELADQIGDTDYIPIYEANMTSKNLLVLDPAESLYGTDSYFNYTFVTLILQRQ